MTEALPALLYLTLLTPVLLVCLYYWKHRKLLAVARKLPVGLPTVPLLGHAYLAFYGHTGMLNRLYALGKKIAARGQKFAVLWLGPYPIITIYSPEDIGIILNHEDALDLGPEVDFFRLFLGHGVILAPVNMWKVSRRHLNPIFYPRNLEYLMSKFNRNARDLCDSMSRLVGLGHVEISEHIAISIHKSSADLAFGPDIKVDTDSEAFHELMNNVFPRINQLASLRMLNIFLWPDVTFRLLYGREIKKIYDCIRDVLEEPLKVYKEKMKAEEKAAEAIKQERDANMPTKDQGLRPQLTIPAVVHSMTQNYSGFSDEQMQHEILSFLVGASSTSKFSMSSCLLALGALPEIQERLHAELVSVVGDQGKDLTFEQLNKLTYCEQFIKETMRKFFIIPMITRRLTADIKLSSCTMPAGSTVGIVVYGPHYDPKNYPNPEKFNPDHFTAENIARRGKNTFLTFSSGPRNCIGKSYAIMVMKIYLAHIVRKYRISTNVDIDNITYSPGVVVRPLHGYKIELKHR